VMTTFGSFMGTSRSGPTGKGHLILFVGKGASIDSTFWRGHCVAPVRHSV